MSFKYRFILSFVLLEIFFILLIVTVNFKAITDSSNKLIGGKIESNISFMKQLLKVPLSIYDIATLDNMVQNSVNLGYVNSLVVFDAKDRILSKSYNYTLETLETLQNNKTNSSITTSEASYEVRYEKMYEDETFVGSFYIIFDTSENTAFIQTNRNRTLLIIFIEILISTFLSYIIGSKLTQMLTRLSEVAQQIGQDKQIEVPFLNKKDEIGILSNSMHQMQEDLSERTSKLKELAIELSKQRNELIEANKAKDDFLANMSHELKTPLNSINIISSVMMKNKQQRFSDDEVKNLSIINSCGNDLLYLINDVLDISKLEAGEIELHYETITFKTVIEEISNMFEPLASQKNLQFDVTYDESISDIYTDTQRVKQIIKNLLSNALKFTTHGRVSLEVKNLPSQIKISVKDEGIGIAQDKLEHIFDRFKQADSSTTRKFGGTGLGLAISNELAKLLEGELQVQSQEGKGTTFTLVLPKNEHKVIPQATVAETVEVNSSLEVLILNDNPIVMLNIVVGIGKAFTVTQANTIEDFLLKVKESSYGYVLIKITDNNLNEIKKITSKVELPYVFLYDEMLDERLEKISKHSFKSDTNIETIIETLKA